MTNDRKVKSVSFDFTNNKEKVGKIEITFNNGICSSTLGEGIEYLYRYGFGICNVDYVCEDELTYSPCLKTGDSKDSSNV